MIEPFDVDDEVRGIRDLPQVVYCVAVVVCGAYRTSRII